MSLRTQIHSAFDEVAPPTFGLPERVVQTALAEGPSRRRKERLIPRLKVPLSMVAVFVAIALVVGVLIGGRLIQDWNSFRNGSPAGGAGHLTQAQLEARPFSPQLLKPGEACPIGPYDSPTSTFGSGPVYGVVYGVGDPHFPASTSWGTYFNNQAAAEPNVTGLVLIRARDLRTGQMVVFIGPNATGSVLGTDIVNGQAVVQRGEVLIDTVHTTHVAYHRGSQNLTAFPYETGTPTGGPYCYGWQFDGDTFSEVFTTPS
jgi:hypothetical protein